MTSHHPDTVDATRLQWVDIARGIAITLVVVGHALRGLRPDMVGPRLADYDAVVAAIYSFHMPAFFFLSGLFFFRRTERAASAQLRSMLYGLVIPYVIWSTLFVVMQAIFPAYVNKQYDIWQLARLYSTPVAHMWFLHTLLCLQLLNLAAFRLDGRRGIAVIGILLAISIAFPQLSPDQLVIDITGGGIFFALGAFFFPSGAHTLLARRPAASGAVAALSWLGCFIVTRSDGMDPVIHAAMRTLCAFSGTVAVIAAATSIQHNYSMLARALSLFGVASLSIYVCHTIFSAGMRALLLALDVRNIELHIVLQVAAGLVCPLLIYTAAKRFGIMTYIGFGPDNRLASASVPR